VKGLLTIGIVLLLMAGGSGIARTRHTESLSTRPQRSSGSRLRMVWKLAEYAVGAVAALIVLASGVYQAAGPFWPTPPGVVPPEENGASPVPLPFAVVAKNVFFPLSELHLVCTIDLLYFRDSNNRTGIWRDAKFVDNGDPNVIPASYNCGSDLIRVQHDGSVEIGFPAGQRMNTPPGAFAGPITVLKMCVTIEGSYTSHEYTAPIPTMGYQWPPAPSAFGWTREPIALDIDQEKWVFQGGKLSAAIGGRQLTERLPDGSVQMLPSALRCGPPVPLVGIHLPVTPLFRVRRQSDGQEGDVYPDGRVYPPGQKPP
jgi:hypothetical protein